jgi:hypothetical protein
MSTTRPVRALGALLVAAAALVATMVAAPSAHAQCISNPPASRHQFTGVVVRTDLGQRIAYVTTEDGRDVVVRGTEATHENEFTTVDRTYFTGHTYLFHPSNGSSPYQDSICSLTTDLGPASTPTATPVAAPELELVGDDGGPSPVALWSLGALLGAVLLVTGIVLVRRGRPTEQATDTDERPAEGARDQG